MYYTSAIIITLPNGFARVQLNSTVTYLDVVVVAVVARIVV